jgi:hypothetical protein
MAHEGLTLCELRMALGRAATILIHNGATMVARSRRWLSVNGGNPPIDSIETQNALGSKPHRHAYVRR